MMSYAVVTIGYKSIENVVRAVEQASNCSLPPDELVVVINPYGDYDETDRIYEYVEEEKRITRWVLLSENVGCAKAFNIGFSACRSDYIVALSDDCAVGPNTYEAMMKEFEGDKVGVVGVTAGGRPDDAVVTAQGFLLAYRKEMISNIGGYDEVASPLADEREFGLRAASHGWSTAIVEGCEFHHIHDISNHPTDNILYMGKEVSPKGKNPFQHETQAILDSRSDKHNERIRAELTGL